MLLNEHQWQSAVLHGSAPFALKICVSGVDSLSGHHLQLTALPENTVGSSEESSEFVKSFEKTRTPRTLYAEASQKPLAIIVVECSGGDIVASLLGSWGEPCS